VNKLPITHLTLYKHGVGFFERRGSFSGENIELTFRQDEMDDILKSLTVLDFGEGKILSAEYATPQTRQEKLSGCSISLGDDRSLRDLLTSLRGRRVRLLLDQEQDAAGVLLGLDAVPDEQPVDTTLVSILLDGSDQVQAHSLSRVKGLALLEEASLNDLRFFLQNAQIQEDYRQVMVHLTPGEHNLSVSYCAPAPTWRMSYRLVVNPENGADDQALLQGWGIFDNRLEEDLKDISLSLVAGMPISFIYDLYQPFTPERPHVDETGRTAVAPPEFEAAARSAFLDASAPAPMGAQMAKAAPPPSVLRAAAFEDSTQIAASAKDLGELFQYSLDTPVSVGRGQSAMAPVLSQRFSARKDLIYNEAKFPAHPVATLRLENTSGMALERGPITVIEDGEYVGEALLSFTAAGGEMVVPYSIELSLKVSLQSGSGFETHSLSISGGYLLVENWDIRWYEYQVNNHASRKIRLLLEHPRSPSHSLFDTPDPAEKTDQFFRFEVEVPAGEERKFKISERRLTSRREELRKQSLEGLQRYLKQGLIAPQVFEKVAELQRLWEQIEDQQQALKKLEAQREKVFKSQSQITENMKVLSNQGKEGALRARYVSELEASQESLKNIASQETQTQARLQSLEKEVAQKLAAL
jgi:hypothetical protein